MPTRRVELTKDHLQEAKAAAEARVYTSRDPLIFAHVAERGLQLRVQDSSVSWLLKFNGSSKSLGKLSEVPTIKAAVERAQNVRALMRRGEDVNEYLKSLAVKKDHSAAAADAESRKARADGAWTWEQLGEAYVAEYLSQPKVTKRGVKPPSERTVQDFQRYGNTVHHQKHMNHVLVRDITPELIEKVRNLTRETNGPNAARKVVQWISGAMSWGQEHHKLHTGLGIGFAWWKAVSPGYTPPTRTRFLDLEQIARVLYVAEKFRELPGRKQKKEVSEAALAALWWIVLTAQRTSASMGLLAANVIVDKEKRGWKIAAFPAEDMKSKRYHALPLPSRVALLLERAKLGIDRESAWAFPSKKVRRSGSEAIEDLHAHDTIVNMLIRRLRGKDPVGLRLKAADLLNGIPHFSPHDLRRSLATILSDMKVRGDAASAILDHSSDTPGAVEFREAEITRMAYNQSQRLGLKREAMETWTNAVFEAVEKEWKRNQPKRSLREMGVAQMQAVRHADLSKGIPFSEREPWYLTMERQKPAPRKLVLKKTTSQDFDDHEYVNE